jgi:hypothetical protein
MVPAMAAGAKAIVHATTPVKAVATRVVFLDVALLMPAFMGDPF